MLQYNKAMKKSIRASHCNNKVEELKEFAEEIQSYPKIHPTFITHLWIISWFSDRQKQMNEEELAVTFTLSF